jgi:hypothetical protein
MLMQEQWPLPNPPNPRHPQWFGCIAEYEEVRQMWKGDQSDRHLDEMFDLSVVVPYERWGPNQIGTR